MRALWRIMLTAMLAIGLLAGCSDEESVEEPGPVDDTPPTLIGSYPQDGQTGVSRSGPYWFAFDEEMDPVSVEDNVSVSPGFGFDIDANAAADTFWLTPHTALPGSASCEINIGPDCGDVAGNEMGTLVSIDFTTTEVQDMDPPTIVSTYPADGAVGAGPGDPVIITFSEPVAYPGPWESQTEIAIEPYPEDGYFEREVNDLLIYHMPFPVDSLIEITVNTDLTDISGNSLEAPYTFSFRTLNDTTRPYLASASPANGATGVATGTSRITLTFSEPMFPEFSMPPENVDAKMLLAVDGDPAWNGDNSEVILEMIRGLLPGCTYWVYFEDVTDMAGNPIDPNPTYYWFRTSGQVTYYPVRGGDLWYFLRYGTAFGKSPALDMGTHRRVIENYSASTGEFEEVWYYWSGDDWVIAEKTFLRVDGGELMHLGREEFDDGILEQTMMWDSPMIYLRLPPQSNLGTSWDIGTTADMGGGNSISLSGSVSISSETFDIVVPFAEASFRDCLKWILYVETTFYEGGTPVDGDMIRQTFYLSEGVGPVMVIQEDLDSVSEPDTMVVSGWDLQ